ncbi:MAG: PKD domain-containing protein, partial [Myxococcota bacterium]
MANKAYGPLMALLWVIILGGCSGSVVINSAPEANIPKSIIEGKVGNPVLVAGEGKDIDGDALTYQWSIVSFPTGKDDSGKEIKSAPVINSQEDGSKITFTPRLKGIYFVKLIVSDGSLKSNPAYATIYVSGGKPNVLIVDAGKDQVVTVGETVTLTATVQSDPPDLIYSAKWEQLSGTPVGVTDWEQLSITFKAPDTPQEIEFKFTADDHMGTVSSDTVKVTVIPANRAPVADAGKDQQVIYGSKVILSGLLSFDPDVGDKLTYRWEQVSGKTVEISDNTNVVASFTAPEEDAELVLRLTVKDSMGLSSSDETIVLVRGGTNRAPVANAGEDQTVRIGSTVYLNGGLSYDEDGDPLSYEWIQKGGTFTTIYDSNSVVANFKAPNAETKMEFSLIVFDGKAYSEPDNVIVDVKDILNNPPVANAGDDQTVSPGSVVVLSGLNSSDPDGDKLSYTWFEKSGPPVIISGFNNSIAQFIAPTTEGEIVIGLIVSDGKTNSVPDEVKIFVQSSGNHSPVANAGKDQIAFAGGIVKLDGSQSFDPDGDNLTYSWYQIAGDTVRLDGANNPIAQFTAPNKQTTLKFLLIVNDGKLNSAPDEVTIRVKVNNNKPRANAGLDQTVSIGQTVYLSGILSEDQDDDPLTYRWTQIEGEAVSLEGETNVIARFVAPQNTGVLKFQLIVNDGMEDSDPAIVNINVTTASIDEPIAVIDPPFVRTGFSKNVTLDGSRSSDPQNRQLTYNWYQVSGVPVSFSPVDSPSISFVSPSGPNKSVLEFGLVVHNGYKYSAPAKSIVNSEDERLNRAPVASAGDDQDVLHGRLVTIKGTASDADGDPLNVKWVQIGGTPVNWINEPSAEGEYIISFVAPESRETLRFKIVADDLLVKAEDIVAINVTNTKPVADAGADISITATGKKTQITLDGSKSFDADGDNLTYKWRLNGNIISQNAVFSDAFEKGSYVFELEVSDGVDLSTDTVNVEIRNAKPVANAGPDLFVASKGALTPVILDGSQSYDPDEDPLTYVWRENGNTIAQGKVAGVNLINGRHIIQLEVSDGTEYSYDDVLIDVDVGPPYGSIVLNVNPSFLIANGVDKATVTSDPIKDENGTVVKDGNLITVSCNLCTINAQDEDAQTQGIQLKTINGIISFEVVAGTVKGTAVITAQAVPPGTATGSVNLLLKAGDPAGNIILSPVPKAITADGVSESNITSDPIKDSYGNIVEDGNEITISATAGTIVASDVNGGLNGIQVGTTNGVISFKLRSTTTAGSSNVSATSVKGNATGSTTVNFISGNPAGNIVLYANPTEINADGVSTSTITSDPIKDGKGNTVPDGVFITVSTTLGGITSTDLDPNTDGIQVATDTAGKISFVVKSSTVAGTATINAASVSGSATGSTTLKMKAGSPHHLSFTIQPPSTAKAGEIFSTFTVSILDANNNLVDWDNSTQITISSTGTSTLNGTVTKTVSGGIASFDNIFYTKAETIKVRAQTSGVADALSNDVLITAGNPSKIVFDIQPPSSLTVGSTFDVKTCTADEYGNIVSTGVPSYQVGLRLKQDNTLEYTPRPSTSGGCAIFTGVGIQTKIDLTTRASKTPYNLEAFATGYTSGESNAFTVNPGPIDHIIYNPAPPFSYKAGSTMSSFSAILKDLYNNTIFTDNTTVISLSLAKGSSSLSGTTLKTVNEGVATFSDITYCKVETIAIKASTSSPAREVTSSDIGVVVGDLAKFSISGIPASVQDCASNTVTVIAQDSCNNTIGSYRGTVHFSSNDTRAQLPPDYTFTASDNGTHIFTNVQLKTPGSNFYVRVNDTAQTTITGEISPITVTLGPLSKFEVKDVKSPFEAGTTSNVTVTAKNACDNTITNFTGTIHFSTDDTNPQVVLPPDYTFVAGDNGTKTFTNGVKLITAGTRYVKVEQVGNPAINGQQGNINVTATTLHHLSVYGLPDSFPACATKAVTVEAKDVYGNRVTTYTGTVKFSSNDAASTLPSNYTFVAGDQGLKVINGVILRTLGSNYYVKAEDTVNPSINGQQSPIEVIPGDAKILVVDQITSPIVAGTPSNVRVTAYDQCGAGNGNVAINYRGTIHFTTSDPSTHPDKKLPSDYTFLATDNGTHTFSNGVTLVTAGNQSVTATDTANGSITGTQSGIVVTPLTTDKYLAYATQPSSPQTAGVNWPQAFSVKRVDRYGNDITGDNSTVVNVEAAPGATSTLNGTKSATMSNSVATFSANTINYTKAETIRVRASATGFTSVDSNNVVVNPGSASKLAFYIQPPSPVTAGAIWSNFAVVVQDTYGNNITTDNNRAITIKASTAESCATPLATNLQGTLTQNTASGVATFNNILYTVATSLSVQAAATGLSSACSNTVTVNPGPLDHFTITATGGGDIATQTVNLPFGIDITAQDAFGNTVTSYTNNVSLASNNCGGNALQNGDPQNTTNFTAGKLTNYSVTYTKACVGTYLSATGGGKSGNSNTFDVCYDGMIAAPVAKDRNGAIRNSFIPGDIIQLDGSASVGPSCGSVARYEWSVALVSQVGARFINPQDGTYLSEPATIVNPVVIACDLNSTNDDNGDSLVNYCSTNGPQTLSIQLKVCNNAACNDKTDTKVINITVNGMQTLASGNFVDVAVAKGGSRVREAYATMGGQTSGYRWNIVSQQLESINLSVGGDVVDKGLRRVIVDRDYNVWFAEYPSGNPTQDGDGEVIKWNPFTESVIFEKNLCGNGPLKNGGDCDADVGGIYAMTIKGNNNNVIFFGTDDGYTKIDLSGNWEDNLKCDSNGYWL